jgi:hypothetical protein
MMRRRWLAVLAFLVGIGGFALAIALDEVEGSASWPGGPEIVVPVAIAATVAALAVLVSTLDRPTWPSAGLAVGLAAVGFASAYGGFLALHEVGGGCGYTPHVHAETDHEGTWANDTARDALEDAGFTVDRVRPNAVSASRTLEDGTTFDVYTGDAGADDRRGASASEENATEAGIRVSVSFWPEQNFESNEAADNWTDEHRSRLEARHATFMSDFEAETGWQRTANASWNASMAVC